MGNSSGEENGLSEPNSRSVPSAKPEQPLDITGFLSTKPGLPEDFGMRVAELLRMVHDAQTRALTPEEQDVVATLIQTLRGLLGADSTQPSS